MAYQHTVIQGNVGKDPAQREAGNSTVASFSVAVTEKWTDKNTGEKREDTTWYKVSGWGKVAGLIMQYVKKGNSVLCDGQVKASAYMGQDGTPQASLDLRLKTIQFLDKRSDSQQSSDNSDYQSPPKQDLDSIPF